MPNQQKTEDIFDEVETALKTSVAQIGGQSVHVQQPEPKFKKKIKPDRFIKPLLIVIVICLIFLGAWFLFFQKKTNRPIGEETPVEEPAASPTSTVAEVAVPVVLDTDGDGLDDLEERNLGTNPESLDSDQDGLSDKEEVRIYLTDPWDQDTDGDGIEDGEEVKQNKNPNNPDPEAKIFDLQEEIGKLR